MTCFFVCGANNVNPIKIDETTSGVINKPIPETIINHIQHCPYCYKRYNATMSMNDSGIITCQSIQNSLYLTTHLCPKTYSPHNLNLSVSAATPPTPKTPSIDPSSAMRVRGIIRYSPSKSGTYTTHSSDPSVLVDIDSVDNYNYKSTAANVCRAIHDIDGDAINAVAFNEIHKDVRSKYLPPPMHRFNQLNIGYGKYRNKSNVKKCKKAYTPSNSPKDKSKDKWKSEVEGLKLGLSDRQQKKMDKISKKLQKIKDAEAKQAYKQKRKYQKEEDVLAHIHHHHEHYHHHHHYHPDEDRHNALKGRRKYRHGDTNGFFTEKYKHNYVQYLQKTHEKHQNNKYKKKPYAPRKQTVSSVNTRYYEEEGRVHPHIAMENPTDVFIDAEIQPPNKKTSESQSSYSYEYHSE